MLCPQPKTTTGVFFQRASETVQPKSFPKETSARRWWTPRCSALMLRGGLQGGKFRMWNVRIGLGRFFHFAQHHEAFGVVTDAAGLSQHQLAILILPDDAIRTNHAHRILQPVKAWEICVTMGRWESIPNLSRTPRTYSGSKSRFLSANGSIVGENWYCGMGKPRVNSGDENNEAS